MAKFPPELLMHHLRELAGAPAEDVSDAELVRRFAVGRDEAAFAALLRRHAPLVLGVCRRVTGNEVDAEDVFQATFLVLARNAAAIRKGGSVGSWLYGVALQLAVRARAAAARRRERERQAPARPVVGPEAEAGSRELAAVLDEELGRLSEKYRAPLVLCYLEGLTRDEAAHRLGWAVRTLMRRLERGRELLRHRLTRRGVALSLALCAAALSQSVAAAVPAGLAVATLRTALAFAGAPATAGPAALANGFLRAVALGRRKVVGVVLLAACVLAAGLGLAARQAFFTNGGRPSAGGTAGPADGPAVRGGPEAPPPEVVAPVTEGHLRQGGPVRSLAFARVGNRVAAGADEGGAGLCVWDAGTGAELYHLPLEGGVSAVAFSRDGKTLAAGGAGGGSWFADPAVRLLDATTGNQLRVLRGHGGRVNAVAFGPDGKTLFSGSQDGTVRQWDVADRKELWQVEAHGHAVLSLTLSPDGRRLAVGCQWAPRDRNAWVFFWDVVARKEIIREPPPGSGWPRHGTAVSAVAYSPDGRFLATGGMDGAVILYDAETWQLIRMYHESLKGLIWSVMAVAFSPDGGTLAVGCVDGQIHTWETATGKPLRRYRERDARGHTIGNEIRTIAFSPDGSVLISGGEEAGVRLRKVANGEPSPSLRGATPFPH
jgi:RNA polymerase sigma factor (sigma-70 family)